MYLREPLFQCCNIEIEVHADTSNGTMVNSCNDEGLNLNNLKVNEAIRMVIDWLEKEDLGKRKTQYKLRDWLFSRQRYWGEPMPIIHKHDGSITALKSGNTTIMFVNNWHWLPPIPLSRKKPISELILSFPFS